MAVRFDSNLEVRDNINSESLTVQNLNSKNAEFSDTISGKTANFSGNITTNGDISVFNFTANGDITAIGTITGSAVYNAVYNDYAEFFPRGEETEPGDIIALDENSKEERYIKATDKSKMVVGVHSDSYAHLIGGENPPEYEDYVEYNIDKFIPIGLAGRVMVKFIGQAILGGKVVPSGIAGIGRLKTENDSEDSVIGRLVEIDDKTEIRKLKIIIK